jgi:hypothetical protein
MAYAKRLATLLVIDPYSDLLSEAWSRPIRRNSRTGSEGLAELSWRVARRRGRCYGPVSGFGLATT